MQPFHTKTSFLTFPEPWKSSQNRCQNALKISLNYLGDPLGTLKNTIFDFKTSPRWTPKISVFFVKNRPKILALTVFGPRCLLEASKRLPRPSQEPPRATQEPPRAAQEPRKDAQEPSRGTCHLTWEPLELKVPGARCQVLGVSFFHVQKWSGEEVLQAAASPVRSFPCKRQDTMF